MKNRDDFSCATPVFELNMFYPSAFLQNFTHFVTSFTASELAGTLYSSSMSTFHFVISLLMFGIFINN